MAFLCLQNMGLNSLNAFETLLNLLDILISDSSLFFSINLFSIKSQFKATTSMKGLPL